MTRFDVLCDGFRESGRLVLKIEPASDEAGS